MLAHLDPFRRQAVALALARMFAGDAFSVCVVRDALDAAGIHAPADELATLRLLHCHPFGQMSGPYREALVRRVVALFDAPPDVGEGSALAAELARLDGAAYGFLVATPARPA